MRGLLDNVFPVPCAPAGELSCDAGHNVRIAGAAWKVAVFAYLLCSRRYFSALVLASATLATFAVISSCWLFLALSL